VISQLESPDDEQHERRAMMDSTLPKDQVIARLRAWVGGTSPSGDDLAGFAQMRATRLLVEQTLEERGTDPQNTTIWWFDQMRAQLWLLIRKQAR
jgi:hypothetical protein